MLWGKIFSCVEPLEIQFSADNEQTYDNHIKHKITYGHFVFS